MAGRTRRRSVAGRPLRNGYGTLNRTRRERPRVFKQTILDYSSITGAGASQSSFITYTLAGWTGSFNKQIAMYRYWKAVRAKITWRLVSGTVSSALTPIRMPILYHKHDYDANLGTPSSKAWVDSQPNVKVYTFGDKARNASYVVYPRVLDTGQVVSGATPAYATLKPMWTDVNYTNVLYYGYWWYFDYLPVDWVVALDVELTVAFKDIHW